MNRGSVFCYAAFVQWIMPLLTLLWTSVPRCFAVGPLALPRTLVGGKTINDVLANIVSFLGTSIISICILVFAIGGLMIILAAGKEDMIQKGKTMMTGSVIGLAVVLGAGALIRLLFFGLS